MIQAIPLDVDGCLIDSFESNLDFFQKLLHHFGFSGPTREEYKKLFHYPTVDVIQKVSGLKDKEKIQKIANFGHSEKFPYKTKPLPLSRGVAPVLEELSKTYKLGIITSRVASGVFESRQLRKYERLFSVVMAFEDTKKHKPNPEPLLAAAKRLGVTPKECVYIGDASTDRKAGEAAGMKVIMYAKEPYEGVPLDTTNFRHIPSIIKNLL